MCNQKENTHFCFCFQARLLFPMCVVPSVSVSRVAFARRWKKHFLSVCPFFIFFKWKNSIYFYFFFFLLISIRNWKLTNVYTQDGQRYIKKNNNNRKQKNKQHATDFDCMTIFVSLPEEEKQRKAFKNIFEKTIDGWGSTATTEKCVRVNVSTVVL